MTEQAIAVFDIGKTNKKLTLFDAGYQVLHEEEHRFEEIVDDDGFACDDLAKVSAWVRQAVQQLKATDRFAVKAINVSAYGASLVHLDSQRAPATPLYNYMKPFPAALADQFYAQYGGREAFALETSSPIMGMLNSGLQLYWLKHQKPDLFARTSISLHLPQYFSFLVHGQLYSEMTSIGCHTGLWDFRHHQYHRWVAQEGLAPWWPPVAATDFCEQIPGRGTAIACGVGIHDSSASLVPYLMSQSSSFMLLSTGTWNIALNPFHQAPLTLEELQRDCLHFIDYRGKPVKAARIFLGKEHDYQEQRIAAHFGKPADYYHRIELDMQLLQRLLSEQRAEKKFYPQTMQHTGPLPHHSGPEADLSLFVSYEEAYHQLMLDLVSMQVISLKLAQGDTPLEKLFVSGGFCSNPLFLQLLASYFPETDLYTTRLKRASALGAALLLHRHWNPESSWNHMLSVEKVPPTSISLRHQYHIV